MTDRHHPQAAVLHALPFTVLPGDPEAPGAALALAASLQAAANKAPAAVRATLGAQFQPSPARAELAAALIAEVRAAAQAARAAVELLGDEGDPDGVARKAARRLQAVDRDYLVACEPAIGAVLAGLRAEAPAQAEIAAAVLAAREEWERDNPRPAGPSVRAWLWRARQHDQRAEAAAQRQQLEAARR